MRSHGPGAKTGIRKYVRRDAAWRLIRISVLAGLIVALGMLPIVATTGLAAKEGADRFNTLPVDFELPPAPEASTLYASDGETEIASFGDQYREVTDSEDISDAMKDAIVAAEDSRFYSHNGVDSKGIMRALVANFSSGDISEGASTITMQYVRQVLAYTATDADEAEAATATTPDRKIREARYALAVEKEKSKDEILTDYLNTVYFGHGAYGVGAAAKVYFGTTAADLDSNQAAMLAGIVQSPSQYDPINGDRDGAIDRRNYVLKRMVTTEALTSAEASEYAAEDLPLDPQAGAGGDFGPNGSDYPFFAAYFEKWWAEQDAFGDTAQERLALLSRGGYEIVSSLDVELQQVAEESIAAKQDKNSPYALGSVAMEPGTGQVKVMAVNREYGNDDSDPAQTTNPLLSGGKDFAGYQAGSTFKLFTMLAALEDGMDLSTSYYSPHRYTSQYLGGGGSNACGIYWCPSNASESMTGNHNMWSGFGGSVNTYFVQLEEEVGADKAVEMAERMGLTWNTESDRVQAEKAESWGAFTLGVSSTTPMEMAGAYSTVAAEGVYAEPTPVAKITDGSGNEISTAAETREVFDAEVARAATDAGRCVTGYGAATGSCGGGATASAVAGTVGGPVAGKTGTTDSNSTAWFGGYTPQLTSTTMIADPANPSNFLGDNMTSLPTAVSADVLAADWQRNPTSEFTPPQDLVGQGSGADERSYNPDDDYQYEEPSEEEPSDDEYSDELEWPGEEGDEDDGWFGEDGLFGRHGVRE